MTKATCKRCGKVVYLTGPKERWTIKEAVAELIGKLKGHTCSREIKC